MRVCGLIVLPETSRESIPLDEIKDLDILLMRSKSSLSGNPVDSRVASGMRFSLSNVYHELYELERFDRVGILIVPDDEKTERTPDTITVLFASSDKIELRYDVEEVFEQSMDVAIRQLIVEGRCGERIEEEEGKVVGGRRRRRRELGARGANRVKG